MANGKEITPAQDRGEEEPPLPCNTCQERVDHGCLGEYCPHEKEES